MTKTIQTLPEDIYGLFDPDKHHEIDEANLAAFLANIDSLVRTRLGKRPEADSPLRLSAIGQPDRKVWLRAKKSKGEALSPKTYMKFFYGDLIEQFILFLAKEAGHEVTDEQKTVELNGVVGHIDAKIDGEVADVKSASPYSYKKFETGSFVMDDPFGYVYQLSAYSDAETPGRAAHFVAFDKVGGDITVATLHESLIAETRAAERIEHLKEVVEMEEMPPRCYDDIPDGKSGNMKLDTECSYCEHKMTCWPGLRMFFYSGKPRFLTKVVREPDVPEGNISDSSGEET